MNHRLYTVYALSPLHAGTGQGLGLIDLPVARERATDHPLVPGSSVKGVLRDRARRTWEGGQEAPDGKTRDLFGPDTNNASDFAGALQVSDARVLLFPVQSDRGTFAWVTCPMVLDRLRRDAEGICTLDTVSVSNDKAVVAGDALRVGDRVVLDGLPFQVDARPARKLAEQLTDLIFPGAAGRRATGPWVEALRERLAVVADDSFTWFVKNATELRARIKLDPERGVVQRGGLFYEESLPSETVLAGFMRLEPNGRVGPDAWTKVEELLGDPLQLGGHASTGQGLVRMGLRGGAK